jgi:hypothetical protein
MDELPAGTVRSRAAVGGGVHAMDGDGSSLCDVVGAGELVQIDKLYWADIARERRCPHCQLLTAANGDS